MKVHSTNYLLSCMAVLALITGGQSLFAEETNLVQGVGNVDVVHVERGTLVIDDTQYQVVANVLVEGVLSPKAYLLRRVKVGDKVEFAARFDGKNMPIIVALNVN